MTTSLLSTRRDIAIERLGITDRSLIRTLPPITSQLRMLAKKLRKRKLPASPFYYLKCSADERARRIVELYYSLPKNQRDLPPIEAYCFAISADPEAILTLIVRASATLARMSSAVIASANHPLITDSTVDIALDPREETKDRLVAQTLIHKAVGFLPTPKGSQITVNASATSASTAQAAALPAPPPESTIRRLVDRFNDAPKSLPVAPPIDIPERMPYEDAVPVTVDDEPEADENE